MVMRPWLGQMGKGTGQHLAERWVNHLAHGHRHIALVPSVHQVHDLLHQEVHVLATELLALHAAGRHEAARSSQLRLHFLRDRTIEAIESFLPAF